MFFNFRSTTTTTSSLSLSLLLLRCSPPPPLDFDTHGFQLPGLFLLSFTPYLDLPRSPQTVRTTPAVSFHELLLGPIRQTSARRLWRSTLFLSTDRTDFHPTRYILSFVPQYNPDPTYHGIDNFACRLVSSILSPRRELSEVSVTHH